MSSTSAPGRSTPRTRSSERRRCGPAAEGQGAVKHFYSSKPALLSTLIAGILYPARRISGVPLDRVFLQERAERWTQKPDPDHPGKLKGVLETPKDPVKWPAYIFYFKPVLILLNVVPFGDLPGPLRAGARPLRGQRLGLDLLPDRRGLRHVSPAVHPDAEQSHDRRLQCLLRALPVPADLGRRGALRLAVRGGRVLRRIHGVRPSCPRWRSPRCSARCCSSAIPRQTLLYFLPAAIIPLAAFVGAQYVEFGELYLPYESFGSAGVQLRRQHLADAAGAGRVQQAPRAVWGLPVPHDVRPPRRLLADADLPALGLGRGCGCSGAGADS